MAETESFSAGDLITAIASYFDFKTGSVDVQFIKIAENIRFDFFAINNLSGIDFCDNCNKADVITDFRSLISALNYFIICSIVVGSAMNLSALRL